MEAACGYCPGFVGALGIMERSQLTLGKLGLILETPAISRVSSVTQSTFIAAVWSGRNGLNVHESHQGKMGVRSFVHSFIHSFHIQFIFWTLLNESTGRVQPSRWERQKSVSSQFAERWLLPITALGTLCVCLFKIRLMPSFLPDAMLKFYHLHYLVGYVSYRYPRSRTSFCVLVKKI